MNIQPRVPIKVLAIKTSKKKNNKTTDSITHNLNWKIKGTA